MAKQGAADPAMWVFPRWLPACSLSAMLLLCVQDASDIIDVAAFTDSQPCRDAQRPGLEPNFQVPNPIWDYIPPELISLFVTDTGGHTPSYVYRLLAEFYSREDYTLVNHVSGAHQQTTAQAIS